MIFVTRGRMRMNDPQPLNIVYNEDCMAGMAWIQTEPPKWMIITWIRWRWREPRY